MCPKRMNFIFWLSTLAAVSAAIAIENKPDKNKRQIDSIRSPQNLQYSLVLPHSRVTSFRALGRQAALPTRHQLPPYAVQMEPMVQYSQKDPLYDPSHGTLEDGDFNKNEIQAQPKILNVHDGELRGEDTHIDAAFGPPYGSLQTAPLYSHSHPHYYEEPEPIIEIIIKESNETLPPPPTAYPQHVKKDPIEVFYVKYSQDPHSDDKVIYEKPIPAITPPSNIEEHHRESYVTVTPEPILPAPPSTTLRTIIKPDSEVYHSDSGVKVTFGTENKHHHDGYVGSEGHEETAPRPAIAYPQQQLQSHPPQTQPIVPPQKHFTEQYPRQPPIYQPKGNFRPNQQFAQSRIQFQQPFLPHEQQLPKQNAPQQSFKNFQSHVSRQGPFTPPTSQGPPHFSNNPSNSGPRPSFAGPNQSGGVGSFSPSRPHNAHPPTNSNFANGPPGPNFVNGPPGPNFLNGPQGLNFVSGQAGPNFLNGPSGPSFVNGPPSPSFASGPPRQQFFNSRPSPPTNSPPRNSFPPGPPRTFHSGPSPQYFLNEPKYLQENYHTITTEQLDQEKQQQPQGNPPQSFDFVPRPTQVAPSSAPTSQFHDRPIEFPQSQQLPQQRPPQQFFENSHQRLNPSARPPTFNGQQFHNFRPNQEQTGPPFIQSNQQVHLQQHLPQVQQNHNFNQQQLHSAHPSQQPALHHQTQFPNPENNDLYSRFPTGPSPSPPRNEPQSPARPHLQQHDQPQSNEFHQQNIAHVVPNGGELIASIPKYEQHITVNGPTSPPEYNFVQSTPSASTNQQQFFDKENEQVRLQLAQNVQKQQEEIQRLQNQLLIAQKQQEQQQQQQNNQIQQQQQQHKQQFQYHQEQQRHSNQNQYEQNFNFPASYKPEVTNNNQQQSLKQYRVPQERSKSPSSAYASSTSVPYYQSTSRTVDITPTTQRYMSSTLNSINTTPETKKSEKKKKPSFELPDEVPDDLRQQLLSSGILDNADISVLDYDKVGDTSLDQLPPDQLANFFSAGGGQQIAASDNKPVIVKPSGEQVSRIDDDVEYDQEVSASENVATVVDPPTTSKKSDVEMKVVHFDPTTMEGQTIAKDYVKKDATKIDPVALNDKKYNRYLPLKVSGNQFPVPDILKGRKITSVVVLAPVLTEALSNSEHARPERATDNKLKGIKFVAGDSLQALLKKPSSENFQRWLQTENQTSVDQQSVILLVAGNEDSQTEKEIYMFDLETNSVNKLNGDLSAAFVDAAENNALSRDIEKLALEGDGTPESFKTQQASELTKEKEMKKEEVTDSDEDIISEGSDNVPLYLDVSSMKLNQGGQSKVSISTGYSKTKKGRSWRNQ